MIINTQQAAEKLGCTPSTVTKLVKDGKLTDKAITKEGKKKHLIKLDLNEVREFAKTYKNRKHSTNNNGHVNVKNIAQPNNVQAGIMTQLANMPELLERLDKKIDSLVRVWS